MAAGDRWSRQVAGLAPAAALATSVLYLPQSMLPQIAESLDRSPSRTAVVGTSAQLGYVLGVLTLLALSDRTWPRVQVPAQAVGLAAALACAALAPGVVTLSVAFLAVGAVACFGQIVFSVVARNAPADRLRGSSTLVIGSMLAGIFGGRVVASLLVDHVGWRSVLLGFGVTALVVAPVSRRALRDMAGPPAREGTGARPLRDVVDLTRHGVALRRHAVTQMCGFAAFNTLWSSVALHLKDDLGWQAPAVALFNGAGLLAGLATMLTSSWTARRTRARVVTLASYGLLIALLVAAVGSDEVVVLAVSMFAMSFSIQVMQTGTQGAALAEHPERTGLANTVYLMIFFAGGSVGTMVGPTVFEHAGMRAVAVVGLLLAATVQLARRRAERVA